MKRFSKKQIVCFLAAFAATVALICLFSFVILKGVFYNVYMSRGNRYFAASDYAQAAKNFASAKNSKPKSQEAYLKLAQSYSALGDHESAGAALDEAIERKLTSAETGLEQLYMLRIKEYSAAGQLADAVSYTDGIADQYILRKIQEIRPADLEYSPTYGSYDRTLKMTITAAEELTVYYTTDGTYPDNRSRIYAEPINIGAGRTTVTAIAVNPDGLVSPLLSVTYDVTSGNDVAEFDDAKIEAMVRASLSKPNGVIRLKELEAVTDLNNEGFDGTIKTLSDLDKMPNLQTLILDGEPNIVSFSQLSGKSALQTLTLSDCGMDSTDINVLSGLSALETLDLSSNSLTSISALSGLSELKFVYLSQNRIEDLSPLSACKKLVCIDASQNRITAVPDFDDASSLETLILGINRISDISTLHRFTSLTYLDISKNSIISAKNLASLKNLTSLYIDGNDIANFDFLSSLTKLTTLNVSNTSFVSTKPIAGLKLESFYAGNTGIASLDDIKDVSELTWLAIGNTNVTELAPIAGANALDYLDITGCNIKDLQVLSGLKGLHTLRAGGVDLDGITFANPDIMISEQ